MSFRFAVVSLLALVFCAFSSASEERPDRPNFVWIVSEDNSMHYHAEYFPGGVPSPEISRMAQEGLFFEHAFSNGPVCSAARTTLATCVYGPRLASHFHRSLERAKLPKGWRMFPAYLRDAGYYTMVGKKDFNVQEGAGVWDNESRGATWHNRPSKTTPFFQMKSGGGTHESSVHFRTGKMGIEGMTTDLKTVPVAPYHPDTPLFRYTNTRYRDRIRGVNGAVAQTLAALEEDGLLEDTFVFYFGDHGGVLPRSKGYIYESGVHVPLVVRIPEKWKHLVDAPRGTRVKGFVDFTDMGVTLLKLAGVNIPEHMDGRPFLGEGVKMAEVNARDEAFFYADRFDEKYEMVRALRKGRFKYMRFYEAHYPDGLQCNYRYRQMAYQQWRDLYREGKLNETQRAFFEPKPPEALFDVEADPHETKNLAGNPAHAETLKDLRQRLARRVRDLADLSFLTEKTVVVEALDDPLAFGKAHAEEIVRLADIADLALLPFEEAKPRLLEALGSDYRWERYWALTACAVFGKKAASLADAAKARLKDEEPLVRMRAAEFLAIAVKADPRPTIMEILRTTRCGTTATIVLTSVVFLRDSLGIDFTLSRSDVRAEGRFVNHRLLYLVDGKNRK